MSVLARPHSAVPDGPDRLGATRASDRRPPVWPERSRTGARWLILTVAAVLAAACVPLIHTPRYYFLGDTQVGAYGQWFHLGTLLRAGQWPLLDLSAWHGGNYVAEGQWGLFSPLTMTIALIATVAPDAVVLATAIKFALLVTGAVGVFLLARSYGTDPATAFLAGVAVTLGGATQYLDSPEWVTSQMIWALVPLTWWAVRRCIHRSASPALALVLGLLIVTVGYVYGTIYLILVLIASLLDAALARNRAGVLRVLGIGVCCGLVTVTVYLPGILSAGVTLRADAVIVSDGRLNADMPGLLSSMIPTVLSPASPAPPNPRYPALYIAWFLPLLLWTDARRARRMLRPLAGLVLVLVAGLLWALGPNQIGPLRWPLRVMPIVTLAVVLLFAVVWSHARRRRPTGRRLLLTLAWPCLGAYLIVSRFWDDRRMILISVAAVLAGLILVWLLARWLSAPVRGTRRAGADAGALAIVVVLCCVALSVLQHWYYPRPAAVDRHMPSHRSAYTTQLVGAAGDVTMVGDPELVILKNPAATRELLIASSWYLNPHPVQNVYSTIGFTAFDERYGLRFDGATYPSMLDTLQEIEPTTGRARVDLLSVSTLLLLRDRQTDARLVNPPLGWHIAAQSEWTVTWVRDQPLPSAGGVVWSSSGTAVTELSSTTNEARFRVDSVGSRGGQVVLSRLAWPGYRASGSTLAPPIDGYLLTVDVPAAATGSVVTVRYAPPGWAVERLSLAAGLTFGVIWTLAVAVRRRRAAEVARAIHGPG